MKKIKFSFYNELIPIESTKSYLLYNILTYGLEVLEYEVGKLLEDLQGKSAFCIDEYPAYESSLTYLYENDYLLDHDVDEKARYRSSYELQQQIKFRTNAHIGLIVGTTIICNMGCPYCFEVVKPNKTLNDERIISGIATYMKSVLERASVKAWESFSVVWYGGEPLINKGAIKSLSSRLIELADKYGIPYSASIITNGILLDRHTWQLLKAHRVEQVQITIDGAKHVHNQYRPLKNRNSRNYEQILENISLMPAGMRTNIRVNTDRLVASTLPEMLDDLQEYGIWPQRHDSVSIDLAWLRAYEGADGTSLSHLTHEEFFDVNRSFSELQVARFEKWADKNQAGKPRLEWKLPKKQNDCATYVSPYFFTSDPEGNIHKCWETVHDAEQSSGTNVLKHWEPEDFDKYLSYSRTTVHPVCYNCKYNPVCEGLSCAFDTLHSLEAEHFPCTPCKTKLPEYFREMYLLQLENPDAVALVSPSENVVQTHANS